MLRWCVWLLWIFSAFSAAQSQETGEPLEPLDRAAMQGELERLEQICYRLGLEAEGEICRDWLQPPRPDQQRFYLPGELPAETSSPDGVRWRVHFIQARKRYAAHIFEQALKHAEEGQESTAYRLLWQVLREDPEHLQALKILGPLASALSSRPQKRAFSQPAELSTIGAIQRWQSRHFEILSRLPASESQRIARELEQFYALWTQCFYEVWAPPNTLKARIAKGSPAWPEPTRISVMILGDRQEYLKVLGVAESKIAISVGYYSPQLRRSYFYSADSNQDTLYHELTHQLFAEGSILSSSAQVRLDQVPGAWCIEGIALYMESLRPSPEGWTLGGVDAVRLQTARYRALRDGYWPEWQPFQQATIAQWKEDSNVALSYSHAAGLTHLFFDLHPDKNLSRANFVRYLSGVYAGSSQPDQLLAMLGADEPSAADSYRQLLQVTDGQLEDLLPSSARLKQLVLSQSQLGNWQLLQQFRNLEWLDASFANLPDDECGWLKELQQLERLGVEGTRFGNQALSNVAKLPKLTELDLSLCKIDDKGLKALANHPNLEVLWLNQTLVTTEALKTLESLPKLKQCDVANTQISPAAWNDFASKHPRLRGEVPVSRAE